MQKNCFLCRDGQTSGPFAPKTIRQFAADGTISPDDLIGEEGTRQCFPLRSIPEFAGPMRIRTQWDKEKQRYICYCPGCRQKYAFDAINMLQTEKEISADCEICGASFIAELSCETESGDGTLSGTKPFPAFSAEAGTSQAAQWDLPAEILDGEIQCPHCWKRFSAPDILYISTHSSLTGDPVLGEFAQQRFAPTLYTPEGIPLDAKEMPCTDMACPHCHLPIPSSVVDLPSTFISIVGAPSAGKSYYLTSLVHQLRETLPRFCSASFADADPTINQVIDHYENQLYFSSNADGVTILKKTDTFGPDFTDQVTLHGLDIQLPKPFIFLSQSMGEESRLNRNFVFYDNAGELFQPGMDTAENPGTQHLASSDGIFFLFDPLNDSGMREICNADDPQLTTTEKLTNQTTFFAEMVARIRRHCNLTQNQKASSSLIVLVGKYDNWCDSLEFDLRKLTPCRFQPSSLNPFLDLNCIHSISFALRQLMLRYCPGIVSQAETFFQDVIFLPCSSFGKIAARQGDAGKGSGIGIAPRDIHPIWIDVPFFLLLSRLGFFPGIAEKVPAQELNARVRGSGIVFPHPVTQETVTLPSSYAGRALEIGNRWYRVPGSAASAKGNGPMQKPLW